MNTKDFTHCAGLFVRTIKSTDEKTGKIAEEYVEAVIARKKGKKTREEVQAILDKFPHTNEMSGKVSSLVTALFTLVFGYEMPQ